MLQSIKERQFRTTILHVVDGFSKKSHSVVTKSRDGAKLLAQNIGKLGDIPVPEELTRGLCVGLCVGTLGADVCAMVVANSSRQHLDTTSKEKPVDPWLGIWQCATTMSVVCALLLGAAMYHSDTPGDPMMGRYKRIVTHSRKSFFVIGSQHAKELSTISNEASLPSITTFLQLQPSISTMSNNSETDSQCCPTCGAPPRFQPPPEPDNTSSFEYAEFAKVAANVLRSIDSTKHDRKELEDMGIFSLIGSWFCLLVGVGVWS